MFLERLENDEILITVDENMTRGNVWDDKCREIEFTPDIDLRSILFRHASKGLDFSSISSDKEIINQIKDFAESEGFVTRKDDCIENLKTFVQYRYYRDDDIMNIIVRKGETTKNKIHGNTIIDFTEDNKIKELTLLYPLKDVDISMLPNDEQELVRFVFYENFLDNVVEYKTVI